MIMDFDYGYEQVSAATRKRANTYLAQFHENSISYANNYKLDINSRVKLFLNNVSELTKVTIDQLKQKYHDNGNSVPYWIENETYHKYDFLKLHSLLGIDIPKYLDSSEAMIDYIDKLLSITTLIDEKGQLDTRKDWSKRASLKSDGSDRNNLIHYYYNTIVQTPITKILETSSNCVVTNDESLDEFIKEDIALFEWEERVKVLFEKDYSYYVLVNDIRSELERQGIITEDELLPFPDKYELVYLVFYTQTSKSKTAIFTIPFDVINGKNLTPSVYGVPEFNWNHLEPFSLDFRNNFDLGHVDIAKEKQVFDKRGLGTYWESVKAYFEAVTKSTLIGARLSNQDRSYELIATIVKAKERENSATGLIKDTLLSLSYSNTSTPLFTNSVRSREDVITVPVDDMNFSPLENVGHMDSYDQEKKKRNVFALDPSQRTVLNYFSKLEHGELLAVNGPPGTGKTAMLKSVIASMWVKALLEKQEPPLIVACGATNQSVTNIIEAFGTIAHTSKVPNEIYHMKRWIKDLPSYGAFAPASTRYKEAFYEKKPDKYKELAPYQIIEPNNKTLRLNGRAASFQKSSTNKQDNLTEHYCNEASLYFNSTIKKVADVIKQLQIEVEQELSNMESLLKLINIQNIECFAQESSSFLLQLFKKHIKTSSPHLKNEVDKLHLDLKTSYEKVDKANLITECKKYFYGFIESVHKVQIFHLSARIYEGKWLIKTSIKKSYVDQLRDFMMLCPIIVSTSNNLPKLFGLPMNKNNVPEYAFDTADLLIIDESGQESVEKGHPMFAFAKKALIVGDTDQIQPVWSFGEVDDKHLKDKLDLREFAAIIESDGYSNSSGSVMKMAQGCSKYSLSLKNQPAGLMLTRHYRCHPLIIEFCNKLIYNGLLIPILSNKLNKLYHPFSYVEIRKSTASASGSSWVNHQEAKEIANFLHARHDEILNFYESKDSKQYRFEELIAILTPFAAQSHVIKRELRRVFDDKLVDEIVVGTAHSLQGSERPIVLFSTVANEQCPSNFLNNNTALLNVAVSRAKDVFILFGDPKRYLKVSKTPTTPTQILSSYIREHAKRIFPKHIVVVESPNKVDAISSMLGDDFIVLATGGHFRKLDISNDQNIDINNNYKPTWIIDTEKIANIELITSWIHGAETLILATDDDREGEAIAWHLLDSLQHDYNIELSALDVRRIRFHEITTIEVERALQSYETHIDEQRAKAAITRQIIDFMLAQQLSKKLSTAKQRVSIGRVQAALIYLLEKHHKPDGKNHHVKVKTVLDINGTKIKADGYLYNTKRKELHFSKESYNLLKEEIKDTEATSKPRKSKRHVFLPQRNGLDTITVLKMAYQRFGYLPHETMQLLQDLYERGV
jgi:hypothetical protein